MSDQSYSATKLQLHWTLACATGELIGMAAAAGFAMLTHQTIGEPTSMPLRWLVLAIMVFAGCIEGDV